jgi:cysteinyl-tRNA synthetase
LHIAEGLARLFEFISQINRHIDEQGDIGKLSGQACLDLWIDVDRVLGLQLEQRLQQGPLDCEIESLIEERNQARKERNFARADEIRKQLAEGGVVLEDTPQGVRWKRNP